MRRSDISRLLWRQAKPIYMLLDSALIGDVSQRLMRLGADWGKAGSNVSSPLTLQTVSLYEGKEAIELQDVAPILVAVGESRVFLDGFVEDRWGWACGVYCTSARTFDEVVGHFRKLIKVETEGGELMFFRFYDPRVLRVFLP